MSSLIILLLSFIFNNKYLDFVCLDPAGLFCSSLEFGSDKSSFPQKQLKLAALWIVLSGLFGARSRVHWFKNQFSSQDILNSIYFHTALRLSALGICYRFFLTNTVKIKNPNLKDDIWLTGITQDDLSVPAWRGLRGRKLPSLFSQNQESGKNVKLRHFNKKI